MIANSSPDVIVIGGGIIGSSIAVRLAQAGARVSIFDRGEPGREASSAAAGMIAPQAEGPKPEAFAELCGASYSLYPEFVAEMEDLSGIAAGYHRAGSLLLALDDAQAQELDETEAETRRRGLAVERLDADAVRRCVPGLGEGIRRGLLLPGDHWVDNERLTEGVLEAARRLGVTIHANATVCSLSARNHRIESIKTDTAAFRAAEFVLAAGCWSGVVAASAGLEVPTVPCRGQMLEFEAPSQLSMVVRAGDHYLVPRAGGRILVGTTADYVGFEKAVTAEGLASILSGALRLAPFLGKLRFRRAWAGLRPDTADHLPILGRARLENVTLATGHFRNGILLAPFTARLMADLVAGGTIPPELEAFRPERFALGAKAGGT
jgi:glycine oxidase